MADLFKFKIGSADIAGERSGEGESIVFLHAGVADRRMWRGQLSELEKSRHVVAYDRRGFGETIAPDESFSHVEDLREVLDRLGISSVSLVGSSQGGRIAVDFTLAYPQRVAALVLVGPAISGAPEFGPFSADIQTRIDALEQAEDADDIELINTIEANLWLDGPSSPEGRGAASCEIYSWI